MGLQGTLSRRNIFKGAVGVAAGGAVLAQTTAAPASAATAVAQATSIEPGALAPAVVALTDATTIAVDASLGNDFRVTLNGNRTMATPSNATAGQQIIFQVSQGAGAPFTLSWSNGYEFSTALPQPSLSATPGQTDLLGFVYDAGKSRWLLAAFVNGFA